MKKRVRVYKAGGESNQPTQEQIVNYISQRMSADDFDGDTDALKAELAQAGIEDTMADDYISYVSDNLGLEDNAQLDEETQLAAEQEQANAEEEQALLEEQQAAEEEARQQQQAAMYNVEINPEDTEDTPEDEATYMRQGGTNLSKRNFIKQYTKFAKMAQGGDTPSPGSDDVLNGREAHVKGFLGAVKNTAQEAAMKQEAEDEYNSAYGAPQVGAFQEGGIQQEQVDIENPMHHIGAYATGIHDIFDNPQVGTNIDFNREQYGGFTDTESGLYKFIGGGDNESADEEYQDADIDFNQEQYQMGGFRMPGRSGRQYAQAVGSPYYTASGQAANPVDLANRKITSVNVTKKGLLGRPKAYTVNYDGNTSATPTVGSAAIPQDDSVPQDEFTGSRQPLANFMMRTGVPGVRGLGAKMIKSGPAPVVPNVIPETFGTNDLQKRDSYGAPIVNKTVETYGNDSYDKNRLPSAQNINTPENQKQIDQGKQIETTISNQSGSDITPDELRMQEPLLNLRGPAYTNNGVAPTSNVPVNPIVNIPVENTSNTPIVNTSNQPVISQEQPSWQNKLSPFIPNMQTTTSEPTTSSQTKEFCYPGGKCFTLSEDQMLDSRLFNDLPDQLRRYSSEYGKGWENERNGNLDLSKLSEQDVIDAINSQRSDPNSALSEEKGDFNTNDYAKKWLKFQQDNQREFNTKDYRDLSDPFHTAKGESPYQKYAEWLNATGTYDEQDPYNIAKAKGMLHRMPAKAYGGPIDYTEYAYGGDIAIPELHRAAFGEETNAFDPNANPLGTTKDYKGDTVDFTGRVIKKRDSNFTFGEDATKLKNPFIMDENYANPLTGEKPAVMMGADGAYKDNTASDLSVDPNAKQGTSEDYKMKRNWGDTTQKLDAGINFGVGVLNNINNRKLENQFLENTTAAESNYGISNKDNRGTYDPNSGLFRPNKMGFNGVVKYGGGIYAMGGNTMDEDEDVEYMTEDQIKRFLAEGGELEYV